MSRPAWWRRAGSGAAAAAVWVGRRLSDGYHAVDPDVRRHVFELPLLGYTLFSPRRHTIEPGESDDHPPVVFVHGLGGRRGDFLLMERYLRWLGRRRTFRIHLSDQPTVEQRGEALAAYAHEVLDKTQSERLDIVAHSLGGLVARLAIADHRLATRVRRLITLGTPHRGTHLARLAGSGIARGLRPDSPLFSRLDTHAPDDFETVCFWSRADVLISPPEAAIWPDSRGVELRGLTHYGYLLSPRSWEAVYRALDEA